MNNFVLIAIAIFIYASGTIRDRCFSDKDGEVFWKCIGENTYGLEGWRKNHMLYFQAIKTIDGFEIVYYKGEMDEEVKRIIEDSLNCTDSKSKLRNDVKLIFSHNHNGGFLNKEGHKQKIEKFRKKYNIAKNICDYRHDSSHKN